MHIHTTQDLAAAVRGRRRALGLSQTSVATSAGVSRSWLADFEAAKATAEIGNILAVLSALDFTVDLLPPDAGPSRAGDQTGDGWDLDQLLNAYDSGEA